MAARVSTTTTSAATAMLGRRPIISPSSASMPSSLCQCTASSSTRSAHPSVASRRAFSQTSARHADIIRRPRRPYQFTQIVQLSDGSTYTMRTCSPLGMYKSTKDTRNTLMWQPSDKSLKSVEVDEAGKLAAFRERFGRAFDLDEAPDPNAAADGAASGSDAAAPAGDAMGDLIAGYASKQASPAAPPADHGKKGPAKKKK